MAKQAISTLATNASKKVDKLSLPVNTEEFHQGQYSFNNAPCNQFEDQIISTLFEEAVEKYGDNVAVVCQSVAVTYSELNAKANQLAHYLRKCGIGRNSLVVLFLERSLELIVGILAVIKAGGVFIPLSADDPSNRIRRILQDSCPDKIITTCDLHETIVNALSIHSETNIVRINRFFDEKIELEETNPPSVNEPEDPLYVMYTSGSTGIPKGCMIPHRAIRRVAKDTNYIQFDSSDVIAQVANAAFDALTFEMWGALLNGACLHIIPQIVLLSPLDFAKAIKQNNITILCLTSSLLNLMVRSSKDAFDNLRYLFFVGEKANPEIIKELLMRKEHYNLDLNLMNGYGPTECTTFATSFNVKRLEDIEKNVPIGKPIVDTTTYVLDKQLRFIESGTIGELYIGGKGVALGYLNDPKQTAIKFIDNPWKKGEKMYKTGDLVYWLPEVGIVYVGRIDSQIKINGFRVEPTEIEATIVKSRVVKQAVVLAKTDEEGRKKLVAYVSFHRKESDDFTKFQQYLRDNLPYYMMPSETIQVDYIPLTLNGKIDKHALINLGGTNILENNVHNIPSNKVEKILIEVWQQLLRKTSISTTQNIFDLGAHSLMLNEACILINARLKEEMNKSVTVIDILTYPTLQQLADFIYEREENPNQALENSNTRASYQRQMLKARNANKCS